MTKGTQSCYYIINGCLVGDVSHPNSEKYPNQRVFVIDVDGYAYLIPYVESEEHIFLKTIIPSRKATRDYLGETNE